MMRLCLDTRFFAMCETLDSHVAHRCLQVRYVGVSNETSYGVSEFVHLAKAAGLPKIMSIQNSYSLLVSPTQSVICALIIYGNTVLVCD